MFCHQYFSSTVVIKQNLDLSSIYDTLSVSKNKILKEKP